MSSRPAAPREITHRFLRGHHSSSLVRHGQPEHNNTTGEPFPFQTRPQNSPKTVYTLLFFQFLPEPHLPPGESQDGLVEKGLPSVHRSRRNTRCHREITSCILCRVEVFLMTGARFGRGGACCAESGSQIPLP